MESALVVNMVQNQETHFISADVYKQNKYMFWNVPPRFSWNFFLSLFPLYLHFSPSGILHLPWPSFLHIPFTRAPLFSTYCGKLFHTWLFPGIFYKYAKTSDSPRNYKTELNPMIIYIRQNFSFLCGEWIDYSHYWCSYVNIQLTRSRFLHCMFKKSWLVL